MPEGPANGRMPQPQGVHRHDPPRRATRRAAALLAAVLALACGDRATPAGDAAARPDIVLVVLDTVRRDHLSVYGYPRPTSPFLETLAGEGRVYTRAYSTSTWTAPSHASLFTGLYPSHHGLHWEHLALDPEHPTLAQRLGAAGYRTAGINENAAAGRVGHFQRGFEHFRNLLDHERTPADVLASFASVLASDDPRPFFVFVNLFAAHLPYNSSGRFYGSFRGSPAPDPMARIRDTGGFLRGEVDYDADELQRLADHYDAEIRYVDDIVRRMAKLLQEGGLWDRTVFVVTADHGENLGDHGLLDHQFALYDTTVHIPLIVRYPPRFPPGTLEADPVQIHDLYPTLLELAGAEPDGAPGGAGDARSLLPGRTAPDRAVIAESFEHAWFSDPDAADLVAHPRIQRFKRRLRMVRRGDLKLIAASDGHHELYDLATDPEERENLVDDPRYAAARDELLALLTERLGPLRPRDADPAARERRLDPETEAALKALGYF